MKFVIRPFQALSTRELYHIYTLRSLVFVVEQNCAYQDPDDKDLEAQHLMMLDGNTLAGYARLLPPGVSYPEPSIGRVVLAQAYRGLGHGRLLMEQCIHRTPDLFKNQDIVISAQVYLLRFYNSLGFAAEGEAYSEDGIPHVKMRYKSAL